jgi:MarR family transcriptional regulator, organic hydroperoxide resistance regulator
MTERTELTEEIVKLFRRLSRALGRYTPEAWADVNLTIGQLKGLFFIDHEGSTNFRKLAAALARTPPEITRIVDRLVEQDLVTRRENPEDRRMLILQTTEKGEALLERLRESTTARIHEILAQLSMEEIVALTKCLASLDKAVSLQQKKAQDERD